jgi:hypothetical protein
MSNYSDDTVKNIGYDDNYYHCSPMESCVPLIQTDEHEVIVTGTNSGRHDYPGNRRIPMSSSPYMTSPASGHVLVRTAGNALQAIPATVLEETQQSSQLIEVQVPPNTRPGDTIHVRSPYTDANEEEVLIAAIIPDGVYPGQTFYVQCPTNTTTSSNTVELTTVAVLATKAEEEAQRGWW